MSPETAKPPYKSRGLSISTDVSSISPDEATDDETAQVSPKTGASDNMAPDTTSGSGVRRSETSDSLTTLVGRLTSLVQLDKIESLPSPMVSSAPFGERKSISISNASPLKGEPVVLCNDSPQPRTQDQTNRAFPSKLLTRLQGAAGGQRHASLAMAPPVASVEMPSMTRHRSQSQVPQYVDDTQLQREPHVVSKDHEEGNDEEAHTITANVNHSYQVQIRGTLHSFNYLETLGEGTYSRVILGRSSVFSRDLFAIKEVDFTIVDPVDRARVETTVSREIALLKRLRHPLIIKMHGYSELKDQVLIALEYCPGGDLFVLASKHRSLLTLRVVRRIFAELVMTMRFLHQSHVVHRDLKLENILLREPSNQLAGSGPFASFLTTLTDLGLAREFDPKVPDLTTRCGSEDYAAPEIIMGQAYDGRQTDTWALGAVLYCLLEGRLPFDVIPGLEHRMISKVLHRICRIEWRWVALKEPGTYDPEWDGAKRIVTNLLRSRTKRWTLEQVAQDEWLREDVLAVEAMVVQYEGAQ